MGTPEGATSTFDAYGNARPLYLDRRPAGLFSSEAQRGLAQGYQTLYRREDRRGGFARFALPGDVFTRAVTRSEAALAAPLSAVELSPWRRDAFRRYGGFADRRGGVEAADVRGAFQRRRALIEATGLNAPVYRAAWRMSGGFGVRSSVAAPPVAVEQHQPAVPTSSLGQRLREGADFAYERARAEGWAWFKEGNYRRAARAFESATLLEPSEIEARVGGLFCHLSLGAVRTSLAILGELTRRDQNAFACDVNLADAYGDAATAREVRIQSQLRAGAGSERADVRALHVLVLWYLGDWEEARRAAKALQRDFPDTEYSDWPARMHAAPQQP